MFKVVNAALVQREMKVGLRNDLDFQILQDLKLDERIAAAPDTGMREGDPVN